MSSPSKKREKKVKAFAVISPKGNMFYVAREKRWTLVFIILAAAFWVGLVLESRRVTYLQEQLKACTTENGVLTGKGIEGRGISATR